MLYIERTVVNCYLLFLKIIKILYEADTEEALCLSRFIDITPFQGTTSLIKTQMRRSLHLLISM